MKTTQCIRAGILAVFVGIPNISQAVLAIAVGDETAIAGDSVSVSVSGSGLQNMVAFQGTLAWNTSLLQYHSVDNFGWAGLGASSFNIQNGKLVVAWVDLNYAGVTPGQTEIFTLHFIAGPNVGVTPVSFGDDPVESFVVYLNNNNPVSFSQIADSGSVTVTAVPEPISSALGIFGGLLAIVQAVRWARFGLGGARRIK